MKLIFATNNQHKLIEVKALLPQFEILSLKDIGCFEEIAETEKTIEGNAKLKAQYIFDKFHLPCFADDTGLEVTALNGEPGVFSARYAGADCNSEANIKKLLQNLDNKSDRTAQFKSVISFISDKENKTFTGICKGSILNQKQGLGGFGYDSIFKPLGFDKSFAEMTLDEKSAISHRGKAVRYLVTFLNFLNKQ